jgi:hypothetical protein
MDKDEHIYEIEKDQSEPDPDKIPIKDRKLFTQPYDLVVESLMEQIENHTIYLRPLSERPSFQRRYVWTNKLASRLIESILLNVPIPPCYLSQNENYELDVIDGQQRLYSIYRFMNNQFELTDIEVLDELLNLRFHQLPDKMQRQLRTHTLRCVMITNESHPEIKFDVFERLNTNTVPLNSQEIRNCVYRGRLNDLLQEVIFYEPWLAILGRKGPDKRMRDEELALRFFAFTIKGLASYHTPQKHWLNEMAFEGKNYSNEKVEELRNIWTHSIDISLEWFDPKECFRRFPVGKLQSINRALLDLTMHTAERVFANKIHIGRNRMRNIYEEIFKNEEFLDLISRAVDHKKRTNRRFELWEEAIR